MPTCLVDLGVVCEGLDEFREELDGLLQALRGNGAGERARKAGAESGRGQQVRVRCERGGEGTQREHGRCRWAVENPTERAVD